MTTEEFINIAKTCGNRAELLDKLGGFTFSKENVNKYIAPWRRAAKLRPWELDLIFAQNVIGLIPTPLESSPTPSVTPTSTPSIT